VQSGCLISKKFQAVNPAEVRSQAPEMDRSGLPVLAERHVLDQWMDTTGRPRSPRPVGGKYKGAA